MPLDEAGLQAEIGITLNKLTKQLATAEARMNKTAKNIEQKFKRPQRAIERGFQQADTSAKSFANGGLRNVSLQLSQVAQQTTATGDFVKALAIQLPDLALGFGTAGIAAGVLAGILLPLATDLIDFGGGAKTAKDGIKELTDAIKSLKDAQSLIAASPASLLNDYGSLADEARTIFEINQQMAQIRAQSALDDTARGIAGELGVSDVFGLAPEDIRRYEDAVSSLEEELKGVREAFFSALNFSSDTPAEELDALTEKITDLQGRLDGLEPIGRRFDDLADILGITDDQAREVVARFAEIGQAEGARQQAELMIELADFIKTASENLADAEDEGREFYDQLVEASLKALELSAVDYQSNLNDGTEAARAFKDELAEALEIARSESFDRITGGNVDFFDPRNESGNAGRITEDRAVPKENRPGYKPPRTRRRGSRSNPDLNEAKRLYQETLSKAERYAQELERINELHRQFPEIITNEVKDRAIKALDESVNKLEGMAKNLESSFESAFTSFVTGSGNASDAARALTQDLIRMASQTAFRQLSDSGVFDGLFNGIFPSAKGNVFSGGSAVTAFAKGGVVSSPTLFPMAGGRTGLMGEAGAEAIMPLVRMPGGDLGVRANGGGDVNVPISVTIENHSSARVQTARSDDGRGLRVMISEVVNDDLLSGRYSKAFQQRFGIRDKARGA